MNEHNPLASTPISPKAYPCHFSDINSISHVYGDGDFTAGLASLNTTAADQLDGLAKVRQKNMSWKRVKASLSRSQSQLVDLFSRGSGGRIKPGGGRRKLSNRPSDLHTIFSIEDEPTLISAQRKPSTPTELLFRNGESGRDLAIENANSANAVGTGAYSGDQHVQEQISTLPRAALSRTKLLDASRKLINPSLTRIFSSHSRLMNSSMPVGVTSIQPPDYSDPRTIQIEKKVYDDLLAANKKLGKENEELWEDNHLLTITFNAAQARLQEVTDRNKNLETAMYQEGKVLSDIIKECHGEIKRLKSTQCELLQNDGGEDDRDRGKLRGRTLEYRIREYYISKYTNEDANMASLVTRSEILNTPPAMVPSPGSGLAAFFQGLPESIAE